MKVLKNIFIGFLVSFLGSIPLSYLNIVGFQISKKFGIDDAIYYILGVVTIEGIAIFTTLIFAKKLANSKKLLKIIELFSIFFMLVLAYIFYSQSQSESSSPDYLAKYVTYSSFAIGIVLSSLNFVHIPFWTGWNLYLLNAKYIYLENYGKYIYLFGTVLGTFTAMLLIVLGLNLVTSNSGSFSEIMFSTIIPLFFVGMALYQTFSFYKKYYRSPQE